MSGKFDSRPPVALLLYRGEDDGGLAARLEGDGVSVHAVEFHDILQQTRADTRQLMDDVDYVIVICSAGFREAFEAYTEPGWSWCSVIDQRTTTGRDSFVPKYVVVQTGAATVADVPNLLLEPNHWTGFRVDQPDGYQELVAYLFDPPLERVVEEKGPPLPAIIAFIVALLVVFVILRVFGVLR